MKVLDSKYGIFFLTISLLFGFFTTNAQTITTVAGNGTQINSGDGIMAISTGIYYTGGLAIDIAGNLYFADEGNSIIRKVSNNGIISTVAGTGKWGHSGDGGLATTATLKNPIGIALDNWGNLYIADEGNSCIRKVNTAGIITTVAGNGTIGYSGDGGVATSANLNTPYGVAADSKGNFFVADYGNNCIRKIDSTGFISTFAGTGVAGFSGDGGIATKAKLYQPYSIAFDKVGSLFIADYYNQRIRKINSDGIITTIAGNGKYGYGGDGGLAINATLLYPSGMAVDTAGNVYIADNNNSRIRMVNGAGIISTVAGNGTKGYSGDEGQAVSAEIYNPNNVIVDNWGNLYISDSWNNRVRKIVFNPLPVILSSFTAKTNIKTIPTNWQTANELNTSYFIIQHSTDGKFFKDIGKVKAVGSGANNYEFTDNNPLQRKTLKTPILCLHNYLYTTNCMQKTFVLGSNFGGNVSLFSTSNTVQAIDSKTRSI